LKKKIKGLGDVLDIHYNEFLGKFLDILDKYCEKDADNKPIMDGDNPKMSEEDTIKAKCEILELENKTIDIHKDRIDATLLPVSMHQPRRLKYLRCILKNVDADGKITKKANIVIVKP